MPRDSELHAQHDPLLVVALAAGDLTGTDRDRAGDLLADCNECATLHDDLLSIARATAALPAARRPRDFRLSPEDAAALRPAGWRRLVAAFGAPRLAFTRQLGVGLTTLGLAGLLFSVLPGVSLPAGGSAAASAPAQITMESTESGGGYAAPNLTAVSPAASAAADADVRGSSSGAGSGPQDQSTSAEPRSAEGAHDSANESARTSAQLSSGAEDVVSPPGPSPILVASSIALAIGLALLLARRLGRRITKG